MFQEMSVFCNRGLSLKLHGEVEFACESQSSEHAQCVFTKPFIRVSYCANYFSFYIFLSAKRVNGFPALNFVSDRVYGEVSARKIFFNSFRPLYCVWPAEVGVARFFAIRSNLDYPYCARLYSNCAEIIFIKRIWEYFLNFLWRC